MMAQTVAQESRNETACLAAAKSYIHPSATRKTMWVGLRLSFSESMVLLPGPAKAGTTNQWRRTAF